MPFKFNPITGVLDLVELANSGNVTGIPPTTIGAIAQWADTTGQTIANSPGTFVQASGAIESQGFVFNKQILANVTVPNNYNVFYRNIVLLAGDIILDGNAEIVLL
jgi:hypothetical protein